MPTAPFSGALPALPDAPLGAPSASGGATGCALVDFELIFPIAAPYDARGALLYHQNIVDICPRARFPVPLPAANITRTARPTDDQPTEPPTLFEHPRYHTPLLEGESEEPARRFRRAQHDRGQFFMDNCGYP